LIILKNIRKKIVKGAKDNLALAIYSVIIAILLWFVISMTFYPSVPKTLTNVKLSLDISGTSAADSGLSVISCDVDTVNVRIKGSRTQVGTMTSDSLTAYIDAENITSVGKKTLNIKVKGGNGISYEVDSISPSTANVVFDKYDTQEFPVYAKTPNITLAEGKTIDTDEYSKEIDIVSITGPSEQLDKISKCYAVSAKAETLSASYTVPSDTIELFTEDGSLIDQSMLTFNKTSFLIKVPVLTQKTVDLAVVLKKAPSNFNTNWLMNRLSLSTDTLTIASASSQADLPKSLEIGIINLSDVTLDYSATFDVGKVLEKAGLKNLSNTSYVTVTFDSSGLAKRDFTISNENIHLSNKPSSNYEYSVLSNSLNITVIGPEDVLKDLTPNDFIAEADLLASEASLSSDSDVSQYSADVTISCSDHNNVWAITKSKINIQKSPKTDEIS
jgi:hypothetical protein